MLTLEVRPLDDFDKEIICKSKLIEKKSLEEIKDGIYFYSNPDQAEHIFLNFCVEKTLSEIEIKKLCRDKFRGLPLDYYVEEINRFHFYDVANITNIYNTCVKEITPEVRQLICAMKNSGHSVSEIQAADKDLTVDQINGVFNKCVRTFSEMDKKMVCTLKFNGLSVEKILSYFPGASQAQIENLMNNCVYVISDNDKKVICTKKEAGFSPDEIKATLPFATLQQVNLVYDKCVYQLPLWQKDTICTLKKHGFDINLIMQFVPGVNKQQIMDVKCP